MFCAMEGVCAAGERGWGAVPVLAFPGRVETKRVIYVKLAFIFMICRMWQGALLSFQCLRTYCNCVRFTVGFSYKANAASLVAAQNLLSL